MDKPLLYMRTETGVQYSPGRSGDDHGPLGADLALAHGIPTEVAELIRYHSPFSQKHSEHSASVEATILRCADITAAGLAALQSSRTVP
jgi:hypothetical protein